jgi:hypothetical protein
MSILALRRQEALEVDRVDLSEDIEGKLHAIQSDAESTAVMIASAAETLERVNQPQHFIAETLRRTDAVSAGA